MKRTPTTLDLAAFPEELAPLLARSTIYDSSCSPEARVYFLDGPVGYYLKVSRKGTLATEAQMTNYFRASGLGTTEVRYLSTDRDYLLTARVAGEDCTHPDYLADPKRLCDLLAERLRLLHALPATDCPIDRTSAYLATVADGFAQGRIDLSYYEEDYGATTPEAAYALVQAAAPRLAHDTLLHGDYCLPNVMLDSWQFSGFIDVGNGGMGDRHIDLFWGAWTLRYNLKTDHYRDRFFDAYGRDQIDDTLLRAVAAAEVFG